MAAKVRLIRGPAGSGKTTRLLERWRAVARRHADAVLWLGPTRRAIEALRPRFDATTPVLLTFQQFADELVRVNDPAARPLTTAQARLILKGLLTDAKVHHFSRVVETRGFATALFALIGELKRQGIGPDALARLPGATPKHREIVSLYARYQEMLREHHLYDVEGRTWQARDLLARGASKPFEGMRFVFVDGFTDLTLLQRDVVESLAGHVREAWLTLPDDASEERAELFTRPREVAAFFKRVDLAGGGPTQRSLFDDEPATAARPAGLAHLERQLCRPPRAVVVADDAAGLCLLEAPGRLGEARLIAREIKTLLLAGTLAGEIVVAVRDLAAQAPLLQEVLAEYGIPADVEGTEPLTRRPVVAALLRALRLPDDDWPFAGVTALLRSGFFSPAWPETEADPDVAGHAEVLLRLIGEPRGRDAYREAVRRWAVDPPPGLEDEQAEESRRDRIHHLACRCRAFLDRFFHAWDDVPQRGPLERHLAWLHRLADDLGFVRSARSDAADASAWGCFEEEIRRWRQVGTLAPRPAVTRKEFLRGLAVLAAEAGLPRSPRGPGRVRVLSVEMACTLAVPYLFVAGLGEGTFPRLAVPSTLLDEADRQALRQEGHAITAPSDRMADEMLLFYQLVTRATTRLTLSYPAVDERGQPLLPCSFLSQTLECFAPGAVAVRRRRMLMEGFDSDIPLSAPEYRVRLARAGGKGSESSAAAIAQARFHEADFTPFEGVFRDPAVIAAVGQQFGPEKIFSPTVLEDYVACPFRFFLKHVLKLEELGDPRDEVEVTRRGQAFHRALARLHVDLQSRGVHEPTDQLTPDLHRQLTEAVEEYAARAGSLASRVLWQLEGQRLTRAGARYKAQWDKFREPWTQQGVVPRPHLFEVDFGLPGPPGTTPTGPLVIRVEGVEVRVSGRIDRVDVAELGSGEVGFWIIDYKTGKAGSYTAVDLQGFRKLQLTLYALAVEQVLLPGLEARPLGLAYWMVADGGPKLALPGSRKTGWLTQPRRWEEVRERLCEWVATLAAHVRRGAFPLRPRSDQCTLTCDFSQVCRIGQARSVEKGVPPLEPPALKGQQED